MSKKAIILLSGGVDSTVMLALAKTQDFDCYALTVSYNQRHSIELKAAKAVVQHIGCAEHRVVSCAVGQWGGSSLTDLNMDVPHNDIAKKLPNTYVPARNTIFLSMALGWAEAIGAHDIFLGANTMDYNNYPDCRPEYLRAFEHMANLATREGVGGHGYSIHAPLIELSKADIIKKGGELSVDFSLTSSCYDPSAAGSACGSCEACRLRKEGFVQANVDDPTCYEAA